MKSLNLGKRASVQNLNTSPEGASEIPTSAILDSPHQPRQSMDPEALQRLSESVVEQGILQPILVRPRGKKFELLAGHRRLAAAKLANLATVPAIVRTVDDHGAQVIALTENLNREDITPIEEAHALLALQTATGWGIREIARKVGRHASQVSESIRVAGSITPELLRTAGIRDFNAVPFSSLKALAAVEKPADRTRALKALAGASGKVDRVGIVRKEKKQGRGWKLTSRAQGGWSLTVHQPARLSQKERDELRATLKKILKEIEA